MTGVCFSLHDELPESVHDLMAMWGGFDAACDAAGCGMEKRLELDFHRAIAPGEVAVEGFVSAMSHVGEVPGRHSVESDFVCLHFYQSVMVLTANRVVVTCAPAVPLHLVVRPLLALLEDHGVVVRWASFMRMNTMSPWLASETSDVIAEEYAVLKSVFPSGHPYLTGPVDRDHFFCFVYDAVDRNALGTSVDDDVQINIYMHNVKTFDGPGGDDAGMKNRWQVASLCGKGYEMLRMCTDTLGNPFMSLEANVSAVFMSPIDLVKCCLDQFCPERFTMFLLQDCCHFVDKWRNAFREINGYTVVNRAVNHIGEGYAFLQVVCIRA